MAYPKTPESPANKLKAEFLKKLNNPGQLSEPGVEAFDPAFHVESGSPYSRLNDAPARSASADYKRRLDSIVGGKTKMVYEYDGDDNPISTIEYTRDTITDPWKPSYKDESSFDEGYRPAIHGNAFLRSTQNDRFY